MTVAAGFAFDDGILFCVDTKITTGIKTNESKLLYYRHDNGKCATVFAISSADLNFPRAAAESCRVAVDRINFDDASIESVRKAIQSALAKFYKEHIFPHPDRTSGEVYLEMLVGIWLNNETQLFVSHETLLNPVEDYECLGSGAYLAKYLIRQYHYDRGRNTLADAGLIASLAVEAAIGYDEGCGGEPEMLILHDSGKIDAICPSVLYPGGDFAKRLRAETWRLLSMLAQAHTPGETELMLEGYFENIRKLNQQSKWVFDMPKPKD